MHAGRLALPMLCKGLSGLFPCVQNVWCTSQVLMCTCSSKQAGSCHSRAWRVYVATLLQ